MAQIPSLYHFSSIFEKCLNATRQSRLSSNSTQLIVSNSAHHFNPLDKSNPPRSSPTCQATIQHPPRPVAWTNRFKSAKKQKQWGDISESAGNIPQLDAQMNPTIKMMAISKAGNIAKIADDSRLELAKKKHTNKIIKRNSQVFSTLLGFFSLSEIKNRKKSKENQRHWPRGWRGAGLLLRPVVPILLPARKEKLMAAFAPFMSTVLLSSSDYFPVRFVFISVSCFLLTLTPPRHDKRKIQ